MSRKPQQPPQPTKTKWHVYKLAAKRQWVGEIEAVDEPMTLGNGVRGLFVICSACGYHAEVNVDAWPDDVPVPSFGPRMPRGTCGNIQAHHFCCHGVARGRRSIRLGIALAPARRSAQDAAMIRMTACRPPDRAFRALHLRLCRSFC
jgi:hypothetical protein